MDHGEAGQGTPFEAMSHEDMLAWLDQANSGSVQGAADRLASAAKEIRKIAEDLKVRPQYVEWKGAGADAFRTWSADLANATLRLGDYSEDASKWLGQASDAIATAQASIPRTQSGAQANLDAALAAHNDPDASAVARKSAETLLAAKEDNRHEAAAQMRKLAQSYSLSATQLDGLEKPAFPPPPQAIVPPPEKVVNSEQHRIAPFPSPLSGGVRPSAGGGLTGPSDSGSTRPIAEIHVVSDVSAPGVLRHSVAPIDMGIDSVAAPPDTPFASSVTPNPDVPRGGRADGGVPSVMGSVPPRVGKSSAPLPRTGGGGRAIGSVRPPLPGLGSGNPVTGVGRSAGSGGIVGGRPVPQTGRSTGALPLGNVIGGEAAQAGRGPMAHGPTVGGGGGGQRGIAGGRRLAGEAGGVVGGRPQTGRTSARPFTPGGAGLVRGTPAGQEGRVVGSVGRAAASQRTSQPRREESGERPDYLIEDEETWLRGGRNVVPPVID